MYSHIPRARTSIRTNLLVTTKMKRTLLIILTSMLICNLSVADRTTRRGLKIDTAKLTSAKPDCDTIMCDSVLRLITLTGYDKPQRATRETMFIKNGSPHHIKSIKIRCDYITTDNRLLHSRDIETKCSVPAGETRQINFKSWDIQQSFHYYRSPKSRNSSATPYKVKCKITAVTTPLSTK